MAFDRREEGMETVPAQGVVYTPDRDGWFNGVLSNVGGRNDFDDGTFFELPIDDVTESERGSIVGGAIFDCLVVPTAGYGADVMTIEFIDEEPLDLDKLAEYGRYWSKLLAGVEPDDPEDPFH